MKIVPQQENVLAAVKRDLSTIDLSMWHRRLGHLRDTMLKKLVNSDIVKDMDVTNTQLTSICKTYILGKMDKKPFEARKD